MFRGGPKRADERKKIVNKHVYLQIIFTDKATKI